jgi:ribose transport system substrate-binding protein
MENPFEPVTLNKMQAAMSAAIAGKGTPGGTPLGVVVNGPYPFWTPTQIGSGRAGSEIGCPVTFQSPAFGDANQRVTRQLSMIDGLAKDGVKGISLTVLDDAQESQPIADLAAQHGTNFMTIDADGALATRIVYLGTDNAAAGRAAGQEMVKLLGGTGKVAILIGNTTQLNAQQRIQGFKEGLAGSSITVVDPAYIDNGDNTVATGHVMNAIASVPGLNGFFGAFANGGPVIGKVLQATGNVGKIKVVAFDTEAETQRFLADGTIGVMIGQRPYMMGYLSIYVLYSVTVLGKAPTLATLKPYLSGPNSDLLDSGFDVVTTQSLPAYKEYLKSVGIGGM